jgi:lysosomal acid lipase/cholesteryl ester hydrolase
MMLFGLHEFLPRQSLLTEIAKVFCKDNNLFNVCMNVIFAISGADPSELDVEVLPTFLGHTPAGASSRQVLHYGQLIKSHRFCQYDYGKKQNRKIYGTDLPPDYAWANITVPIVLHSGCNDYLSAPKDVAAVAAVLPNLVEAREVPWPQFNHLDFLVARNVRSLLYDHVIANVNRFFAG